LVDTQGPYKYGFHPQRGEVGAQHLRTAQVPNGHESHLAGNLFQILLQLSSLSKAI
jgi:hypothetical protein